jgi:hypothetical protein
MSLLAPGRLVVVGGHSRGVGKTTTIEHILRARTGERWLAVKISAHRHAPAHVAAPVIEEETHCGAATQTSRYLHAGAARAWLCRADARAMPEAVRFVAGLVQAGANVIVESNRLVGYLNPETMLFLVSPPVEDWKPSSAGAISAAHAIILGPGGAPARAALPLTRSCLEGRPVFALDESAQALRFDAWFGARAYQQVFRHRESAPSGILALPLPGVLR